MSKKNHRRKSPAGDSAFISGLDYQLKEIPTVNALFTTLMESTE